MSGTSNKPSNPQAKQFGITLPISDAEPTKADEQLTESMVQTLRELGQYESEEEAQRREVVLGKINAIVKEFVHKVSLKKNLPESIANEAGGRIFTFGSYRLGVHGAGADIDTLCVVPVHVDREDFFSDMYELLKERQEVTELTMVPDAYVPVINFSFSEIPIDLLFARLNLPSIPDDLDLSDNNLLRNLDERCVRSLNGSRVTDEILRLVPSVTTFRTALRCIKVWAKRRAIYSNIMGFFGGVAWAMIVARVCQLYPKALAGIVITKFFRIMYQWKWPQPVLLKHIEDGPLQVRVWNPRIYQQDRGHRMPIITPAYPSMCSTHNVTSSTQKVIIREFLRAAELVDRIALGQATWIDLFEKDDFFTTYKYYMMVVASSNSEENQLKWSGLVESKLRQLVMKLEMVENVELAHPYIKSFEDTHICSNDQEKVDVAQGKFPEKKQNANSEADKAAGTVVINGQEATAVFQEYTTKVWSTVLYIGLVVAPKDPNMPGPRKLDISWPISEFTQMVKSWDCFNEENMGISVQFFKGSQLPVYVYGDAGPPPKPNKKRAKPADDEVPTQDHKTKTENGDYVGEDDKPQPHEDKKLKLSESTNDISSNQEALESSTHFPESVVSELTSTIEEQFTTEYQNDQQYNEEKIEESRHEQELIIEEKFLNEVSVEKNLQTEAETKPSSKLSPPRTGISIEMKKSDIKLRFLS